MKRDSVNSGQEMPIDWKWVRDRLLEAERIPASGKCGRAGDLTTAVDECLRIAKHFARPGITYEKRAVLNTLPGSISIEGGLSILGSSLSSYIRNAKYVYLFVVTIGSDLEETATVLMEGGEQLHGYLLDRIGSFAVESIARNLERRLRNRYRAGQMSVSMRFSPGYCDWPIEEQKNLEKTLDFSRAGVRLNESCMMIPRKSISGLVGIGPKGLFSASGSQCGICDKKECAYRREKISKAGTVA